MWDMWEAILSNGSIQQSHEKTTQKYWLRVYRLSLNTQILNELVIITLFVELYQLPFVKIRRLSYVILEFLFHLHVTFLQFTIYANWISDSILQISFCLLAYAPNHIKPIDIWAQHTTMATTKCKTTMIIDAWLDAFH